MKTEAIEGVDLDRQAFLYASHGMSVVEIGQRLEMHPIAVRKAIKRYSTSEGLDEKRQEQRAIQLARLEELYRSCRAEALAGDSKAVQRVLEILARQAALLGLDAPKASIVETKGGAFEEFVRSVVARRVSTQEVPKLQG